MATQFVERRSGGAAFVGNVLRKDSAGNTTPFVLDSDNEKITYYDRTNSITKTLFDSKNGITGAASTNLAINTATLANTVRINSQTDSATASGDLIGFQSKPRTGVAGTQSVYGCQVSAQISDGIALSSSGSIIGGHFDVYLRGTSAGTIAGDVRGLQIELTSDDAGTRDISGYVTGLRIRMALSAGTVTGIRSAIRVEKPEVQTNSETYDALFDLTSTIAGVWNSAPATEPTTADGYIKVRINGANRYIQLYSGAPVD